MPVPLHQTEIIPYQKTWYEFYYSRIGSGTYQNYFKRRYRPFLDMAARQGHSELWEIGCGIGSASWALSRMGILCRGIDISQSMVIAANENLGWKFARQADLFQRHSRLVPVISHGVLEHFTDAQILKVLELYPKSVHYVPLDKYEKPSFGDERLLPVQYWLDLCQPSEYTVFNDGHDLAFKISKP